MSAPAEEMGPKSEQPPQPPHPPPLQPEARYPRFPTAGGLKVKPNYEEDIFSEPPDFPVSDDEQHLETEETGQRRVEMESLPHSPSFNATMGGSTMTGGNFIDPQIYGSNPSAPSGFLTKAFMQNNKAGNFAPTKNGGYSVSTDASYKTAFSSFSSYATPHSQIST
jgi:hypothetical protein